MLKLIDVFILGITNSFTLFPTKIEDYKSEIVEIQAQLDYGMQVDSEQLLNDRDNIYNDLSKAFNNLKNESEIK